MAASIVRSPGCRSHITYSSNFFVIVKQYSYVYSLNGFVVFLLLWGIYECATYCLVKLTMSVSTALSVASVALCTLPALCTLCANGGETQHRYDTAWRNAPADVALSLSFSFSVKPCLLLLLLPLPLWAGPYAPSNYQGYFLQRAKSLFMGMSVCHRALAVNSQHADSIDNPNANRSFSNTVLAQAFHLFCFCSHLRKKIIIYDFR